MLNTGLQDKLLRPNAGLLRLRAISFSMESPVDADTVSILRYTAVIAQLIPTLRYFGLQSPRHGSIWYWDEFCYRWAHVVSRPEQGAPVVEMVPEYEVDALELELLATLRD